MYAGCVGKDELADTLREANKREGVASAYQVTEAEATGACAVVITGHHRCVTSPDRTYHDELSWNVDPW